MWWVSIIVVGLVVCAYMFPSETKGTAKWSFTGLRGVAQDMRAVRDASIEKSVLDPDRVNTVVSTLNREVLDTSKYHKEATKRAMAARKSLEAKLATTQL